MATNAFSASNTPIKPPAYCYFKAPPLPLIPPLGRFPSLNAYARWTDLDPLAPIDHAVYMHLPNIWQWTWRNRITQTDITIEITLWRILDPQPWSLSLVVWDEWRNPERAYWTEFTMRLEPSWDSGLQRQVNIPGVDFQEVRVLQ